MMPIQIKKKRKRVDGSAPRAAGTMTAKYVAYDATAAATGDLARSKPSALLAEVTQGKPRPTKFAPPRIVEFLDLGRNSMQVNSTVDTDEPLFQPFPVELVFDEYTPCGVHQKTLYFRNNDSVARRIKILPPESPYFEIGAPRAAQRQGVMQDGKVAAGMEVCYTVTFKPQERREYKLELVCSTEREKFVVPVSAPGTKAVLNFPDELDFGICPVKALSSKTLVARNVGNRASKFLLTATAPFSIEPNDIYADVNSSAQFEITFRPEESGEFEGEVRIEDESGRQTYMRVTGMAENVNVYLAEPSVEPDPAYISLSSRKSVKILNRSEFPAKFTIKAFATKQEEDEERARLCEELDRMEQLEMHNARTSEVPEDSEGGDGSDNDLSDDGGESANLRLAQAVIRRKYANLRKAVEEDKMIFVDENFQIEPIEGEIWANADMSLTVTFRPQTAAEYDCVAFIDVEGRDTRLPLQLLGKGIGPKASLSYDVLDIGDVFVNSVHKYEITLQNCGDVPCTYELQPSHTPFGPKFSFEPSRGTLEVHDQHVITVRFCSDILGEFSEHFNFKLQGSDEPLSVHFKGHVVGPTFHFDVEELDYGILSYDFLKTKTLTLMNTSEIPMTYALRVPQDGTLVRKEFVIEPPTGTLEAGGRQTIAVDFTSQTVKVYDYYLTVDVEGVGEGLLSVPILGECKVPNVVIEKDDVEFGECFMRYPYQQTLTLVNESDLYAKYVVEEQDEYSQAVASYEADAFKGSIPPFGRHNIGLTMVCEKLGKLRLPLQIKIAGSVDPPLMATVSAVGKGPNVVLSQAGPKGKGDIPGDSIEWGKRKCLEDHVKVLKMHNDSLIPAQFRAFVKGTRSKFRISPRDGVMQPDEKMEMKVTGHFDDIVTFKDAIQLTIHEGANLVIPLQARGTGTTMYCEDDLSNVDFGYQLTNKVCEWKTVLENKGRRVQTLTWVNKTLLQKFSAAKAQEKRDQQLVASGKRKTVPKRKPVEPTFTVVPETVELRPRTMCQFTFRGLWKTPADITELLVLEAKIGKVTQDAFECNVKGQFINPLLEPSSDALRFNYTYSPEEGDNVPEMQSQLLTLTNVSELPLTFDLSVKEDGPFKIDTAGASLKPQEKVTIKVDFYPGYRSLSRDDEMYRQQHDIDTAIFCTYTDHPQKDRFKLLAEINFPNLEFEYTKVDFGCILNDTTKSLISKVKNCSRVPVSYQWAFLEPDEKDRGKSGLTARSTARSTARTARNLPHIPINQVFDIMPIHAYLQPGQEDEVEFVYYGHAERKFKAEVVCEVEGGPEYELGINGSASIVNQNLDVTFLDFGNQPYDKKETRPFKIINQGKVSFPFNIRTDKLSHPSVVEVHPSSGRVFAGDTQEISVTFRPGLPMRIREMLIVELGHFAPMNFPILGNGVYTSLAMSLPRDLLPSKPQWVRGADEQYDPVSWEDLLEQARTEMIAEEQRELAQSQALQLVQQAEDEGLIDRERAGALNAQVQTAPTVTEQLLRRLREELGELDPPAFASVSGGSRPASRMTAKSGAGRSVTMSPTVEMANLATMDLSTVTARPGTAATAASRRTAADARSVGTAKTGATSLGASMRMNPLLVALEQNAERLYFKDYLLHERERAEREAEEEAERLAATAEANDLTDDDEDVTPGEANDTVQPLAAVPPLDLPTGTAPPPVPSTAGASSNKSGPRRKKKKKEKNPFVLSNFVCDMQNVVHLSTKTKKFRFMNSGKLPISFTLDKKLAEANGFSLDPEKVVRLPEGEHVDFEIVFDANAEIPFGPVDVELPILVKNGPVVKLHLRANVTVPDVKLSHPVLNFAQVLVGRAKIIYTQLHNPSPVPAEWGFKKPMGSTRDMVHFTCIPNSGTLQPNERVNISVEFEPREQREYAIRLPLFVKNNTHSNERLRLTGIGSEYTVEFQVSNPPLPPPEFPMLTQEQRDDLDEESLEAYEADLVAYNLAKAQFEAGERLPAPPPGQFGPVLPYGTGSELQKVPVTMTNTSAYPVELFSLEFDGIYHQEEDIMRRADGYDENDIMRCDVRVPGEGLPAHVIAAETKRLAIEQAEKLRDEALAAVETEGKEPAEIEAAQQEALAGLDLSALEPEVEQEPEPEPRARDKGDAHDYVIVGPPLSGKTTMAQFLAEEKRTVFGPDIVVTTLDDVVDTATSQTSELGLELRIALGRLTDDDRTAAAEEGASDELKAAVAAADSKEKQGGKKGSEEPVEEPRLLTIDQLTSALQWRLGESDAGAGFVVDDILCKYVASPADAATALGRSLGQGQEWPAQLLVLSPDEDAYVDLLERIEEHAEMVIAKVAAAQAATDSETAGGEEEAPVAEDTGAESVAFEPKTDEELEALSDEERAKYDAAQAAQAAADAEAQERAARKQQLQEEADHATTIQARLQDVKTEREEVRTPQVTEGESAQENAASSEDTPADASEDTDKPVKPRPTAYESYLPTIIDGWKSADAPPSFVEKTAEELGALNEEEREEYEAAKAEFESKQASGDQAQDAKTGEDDDEQAGDDAEVESADADAEAESTGDSADAQAGAVQAVEPEMHAVVTVPFKENQRQHKVFKLLNSCLPKEVREEEEFILPIPEEQTVLLVQRPIARTELSREKRFRIVLPPPPEPEKEEGEEKEEAPAAKAKGKKGEPEPEPEPEEPKGPPSMRWILQPGESTQFDVIFESTNIGVFDEALRFEAVGGTQGFDLRVSGTCKVPTINNDPRNVFMSRIKQRPDHINVSKKYVTNREQYEFGPLLIGKDAKLRLTDVEAEADTSAPDSKARRTAAITNAEMFRISNAGLTDAHIDFCFASDGELPFYVSPASLDLKEGETSTVAVWAFPSDARLYEDELVCVIADNPEPVRFAVTCLGADPELELAGPWQEAGAKALLEAEAMDEDAEGRDAAIQAAKDMQDMPPVLDFDRLLLGRSEDLEVLVTNTSTVPVKWELDLAPMADLCDEGVFDVSPQEGVLNPGQDGAISVRFSAETPNAHESKFTIKYSDTENVAASQTKEVEVAVKAEAYLLSIVSFEHEEANSGNGELDFGTVRVGERHTQRFSIVNQGKYDVKFAFAVRRALARELFTIEPMEAVIEPSGRQEVAVTFCSSSAIQLENNKDLRCSMMEARTSEEYVEASFSVITSARAVFSLFSLNPSKGINFGALRYNDEPVTKTLEIRNKDQGRPGIFDFTFALTNAEEEGPVMTSIGEDGMMVKPSVNAGTVTVGQFSCTPAGGTIEPGGSQQVEVTFTPKAHEVFREVLKIGISGRDEQDAAANAALSYEIVGESCFPGINTKDFDDIFEEQAVIPKLEPGEDVPGAHFVEQDMRFDFGPRAAANPKGVPERFKIANLQKVACAVNFSIDTDEADGVFEVQPSSWVIPSHEHRYVTVYFKPTAMQRYKGRFRATVEDAASEGTGNELDFEIGGQGIFPCITVEQPVEKDTEGKCVLDFGKLRMGKREEKQIVLKNNGFVPATLIFSTPNHDDFTIGNIPASTELARGETMTLTAAFHPSRPHDEPTTCQLQLNVAQNRYDDYTFALSGQGFYSDITFENLGDKGGPDELVFDDLDLDGPGPSEGKAAFTIESHADVPLRFEWGEGKADGVTFAPSVGHLQPGQKKRIFATFATEKAKMLQQAAVPLAFRKIQYTGESHADWDDRMMVVRYLTEEQLAERQAEAADGDAEMVATSEDPYRVREIAPEPENEPIEGENEQKIELKCSAIADTVKFTCDTQSVAFRQTPMFQTRLHKFNVTNTSKAKLEYAWDFDSMGEAGSIAATMRPSTAKSMQPLPNPYVIEPASGTIEPGAEQRFTISFTPLEVDDFKYKLQADVVGLPADAAPLALFLRGRSVRPICHFDLPPSDYLQRRQAGLPGPSGELGALDPNVHVVEFESLGTRTRNTKRFCVINPQNVSYEFQWTPVGQPNAAFRCVTPSGVMLPGRRSELIFEYTPDAVGVSEAFYRFTVPAQGVNELFLLTGDVTDPRIYLNRNRVDFSALLVGGHASETVYIVNKEHLPFDFHFDRSSFDFGPSARPQISLNPSSGVVPPEGRTAIEVTFAPTEEKGQNYNVPCAVRRKPTKLSLNVKGEGYAIHPRLELQDEGDGAPVDLTSKRGEINFVDLDTVHVGEKVQRKIVLFNSGKFDYEFSWEALRAKNPMLTVTPAMGVVPKGDKLECTLLFNPVEEVQLDDYRLACTIAESRRFTLSLTARAVPYAVAFSFTKHDFGACFVGAAGSAPQSSTRTLQITNNEMDEDVAIDCEYQNTPELELAGFKPTLLAAGGDPLEVEFVFKPRDLVSYAVNVPFTINGTSTVNVQLVGEGALAQVELANPTMSTMSFGTVQAGEEVSRRVTLVNRGRRVAEFELVDVSQGGIGPLEERNITFFPTGLVPLRPRESVEVEVTFAPTARVPHFAEALFLRVAGTTRKLLSVAGVAQGMEVTLDTDTLPFGSVCEKSHVTRHINMENTGDMVTQFQWDVAALAPDFTITPAQGMLRPFSGQKFEITFRPTRIDDDIRYEGVTCFLQGTDSVQLTLTGACITQPESDRQVLEFAAPARSDSAQTVSLSNPTDKPWDLVPVLKGEHWRRGTEFVEVPAKGSATYEVIYRPLSMTEGVDAPPGEDFATGDDAKRDAEHTGELFIALPNGGALQYDLRGKASEPEPEKEQQLEVVAKVPLTVNLPATNWLNEPQHFAVSVEPETDTDGDQATFWDAAEEIVLPPLATRDLVVRFISHREGSRKAVITLRNPVSGEYLRFSVSVTVGAPESLQTLELDAPVRQVATKVITIANPLPSRVVTFEGDEGEWWSCTNERVRLRQLGEGANPMSGSDEGAFEVSYMPIHPEESTADLELTIAELGTFKYKLKLKASAAGLERVLNFKGALGDTFQREFRFMNFAQTSTTFQCSVTNPAAFAVPPTLQVEASPNGWTGTQGVLEVSYEPSALGQVTDVLTLKSADAGEYSCKLFGHCTEPQPQGPFSVPKGGTYDLKFKNVFTEAKQFSFFVDNPQFSIGSASANVGPRAEQSISVRYNGADLKPGDKRDGKVLVTCPSMPNIPAWVFYLHGE